MIPEWQTRTALLLGESKLRKLQASHVLVAGLGGVGGYVAEQLCRAGIGELTIIDNDVVQPSNRNRQLIALANTENQQKAELFKKRLLNINPFLKLKVIIEYLEDENIDPMLEGNYDYIVDAIDTLSPKVNLLEKAYRRGFKVVSSMGAAGKMDPTKIEICDISKSHHCKFAYIVRKYLHRKDIFKGIRVVFSPEEVPKEAIVETNGETNKRSIVGTVSYMPAIFGCYCAYVAIDGILNLNAFKE